ncbi:MAG: hypothetical protein F6K40_05110 [Okeania sp. SIO3I5]|uniref:WD40 repeat domain-containing protein n=1 Tax=Okeania sp. SIO3I5 TaxID=2607805 RepID=UPI0013B9416E|nr:hypothetical protein [Okeania sp. SIO3I5]NEQ35702.1 hypothetical protein [Okeania sp. SIO3I5]
MYLHNRKAKNLVVKLKSISAGIVLSIFTLTVPTTAATFDFHQKFIANEGTPVDEPENPDFIANLFETFIASGGTAYGFLPTLTTNQSVATNGSYAVVGSLSDDDKGSAYLFDTTTGNLLQKFIAPDGELSDEFGKSVAIHGNYALIGSRMNDDTGSAYLFDITTGNFLQKFTAPDGEFYDLFGTSVVIDGNYALISSVSDDQRSGSAYLFDITTGNLLQKLVAPYSYGLGNSVAMDGTYALIGSMEDSYSLNLIGSGSAYLFDVTTGNLLHEFIAPDIDARDFFGFSVAIDGKNALIGSLGDSDNGKWSGSAYLFDVTTGNVLHKFTAPDAAAYEFFGNSVAIDGNYALIGSLGDSDNGSLSGSAYLFDITTGNLLQKLIAPDAAAYEFFGNSVAIDGENIVISSLWDYETNSVSAYLFSSNIQETPKPASASEPSLLLGIIVVLIFGGCYSKQNKTS